MHSSATHSTGSAAVPCDSLCCHLVSRDTPHLPVDLASRHAVSHLRSLLSGYREPCRRQMSLLLRVKSAFGLPRFERRATFECTLETSNNRESRPNHLLPVDDTRWTRPPSTRVFHCFPGPSFASARRRQDAHVARPARQHSHVYQHYRRQSARREVTFTSTRVVSQCFQWFQVWSHCTPERTFRTDLVRRSNSGAVPARTSKWDFPIGYTGSGVGDDKWLDKDYLRQLIAKSARPTSDCTYGIILSTAPGAPHVDGFSDCSFGSTGQLAARHAGTVVATAWGYR
jgi:hypothetical protein